MHRSSSPGVRERGWLVLGLACGLALPWLVGPALDLSVFTGTGTPVPLRPDWAALGLPVRERRAMLIQRFMRWPDRRRR